MTGAAATLLSILMLGTFLLTAGGIYLAASGRDRKKGLLMLVAAAVLLGNVLILTV
jgi:hypothetical protein